jgi:hypothetical protein
VPALQAPFDAVVPSENLAAAVPVRSMGLEAPAFVSPVIVTREPGSRFTFAVTITVMTFAVLASGVLC